MTAGLAVALDILIDQLPITRAPEAREVPAVDDRDRQSPQPLQRFHIDGDVRVVGIIDERPVIDDITRDEDAGPGLEQPDAAGRVTRRMDDLEGAVAEVEDVALVQ